MEVGDAGGIGVAAVCVGTGAAVAACVETTLTGGGASVTGGGAMEGQAAEGGAIVDVDGTVGAAVVAAGFLVVVTAGVAKEERV